MLRVSKSGSVKTPRLDINALNIQRGRDHGIQGYNAYRAAYGLPNLNSFTDIAAMSIADQNTTDSVEAVYE